jgi:hypothetical protein
MTPLETLASWLLLPILVACLWRARLLALAIVPPLGLAIVQAFDLMDTSSASHPLRFVVPLLSMSVAMGVAFVEVKRWRQERDRRRETALDLFWEMKAKGEYLGRPSQLKKDAHAIADAEPRGANRAIPASILVFASGCGDIPALLAWRIPGEWVLVPVQVGMEVLILGVLCAPERWFSR